MKTDIIKTAKAIVIGHAVADALGVPAEFHSRSELEKNPVITMTECREQRLPVGCWSDDTSMSLAVLDALKNNDYYCECIADSESSDVDYDKIMRNFCAWANKAQFTATGVVFDIGISVRKSLLNYMQHDIPAMECGQKSPYDNGNGSLMRTHPISLYCYLKRIPIKKSIEIIHDVSSLTHSHERSLVACGIYSFVLWEILKSPTRKSITKGLENAAEFYKDSPEIISYSRIFNTNFANTEKSLIKSSGYVVDTLEAALWCLLTTESYRECVLKAVNLGDDADTVAAIAGGLAGALYGYDSLPQEWLSVLLKREEIEALTEKAFGI